MTAVGLADGQSKRFAYDPLGRRVSATEGGRTTSYVYDGSNIHLEYDESGSGPTAVYTDGPRQNEVLEMARGGRHYSYLVDGLGSTIALADENGNVVQRYSYDAFGNPTSSGSVPNPFLFTGQQWDPESGLYYDHARYYDPANGRFISRDTRLSVNPYAYVRNDPANATDPTGEVADLGEEVAEEAIESTLDAQMSEAVGEETLKQVEKVVLNQGKRLLQVALEKVDAELATHDVGAAAEGNTWAEEGVKLAATARAITVAISTVDAILAPTEYAFESPLLSNVQALQAGLGLLASFDAVSASYNQGEFIGSLFG